MSGLFKVPIIAASASNGAQYDLFSIANHANRPTILKGLSLFQISEVGDAQEEIVPLVLKTGLGSLGSGGATPTPVNTDRSGGAAGFTAHTMDFPKASGGTPVSVGVFGWNIRVGVDAVLPEEWQIIMPAGLIWTVEIVANLSGAKTVYGELLVHEIG